MAGVVLENVSRVYPGQVVAVDRVDLEIGDGEFMVLLGPSGCGKTTTLRLIAGLEKPSSGRIRIGSRDASGVPPRKRGIAMVFQNQALYPHLNVERNLAFGLAGRGSNLNRFWPWRSRGDERVRQVAQALGIEQLLERFPRQLSGGERQRVALGRAVVRDPAVFLLDEPLSNLDAPLRVELRHEIKRLHERSAGTMVYVTHDQTEALSLGDRVAVMKEGKVQQVGQPGDVYDWPCNRFVAGFVGTPAMNFISGAVVRRDGKARFVCGAWSVLLDERRFGSGQPPEGPASLGVRPEDIRLVPPGGDAGADGCDTAAPAVVRLVETWGDAEVVTVELVDRGRVNREGVEREQIQEPTSVVASLRQRGAWRAGQAVRLQIEPTKVHLFDPASGANWARCG